MNKITKMLCKPEAKLYPVSGDGRIFLKNSGKKKEASLCRRVAALALCVAANPGAFAQMPALASPEAQTGIGKRSIWDTLRAHRVYWGAAAGLVFNNQFTFEDIAEKAGDTVTVREIALKDSEKNKDKPFAFPLSFEASLYAGYPLPVLQNSAVELHAGVTLGGTKAETDFYTKQTYKDGAGTVKAYDYFLADNGAFNLDADFIYNFAPLFKWPSRVIFCAGAGAGYAFKFSPYLVEYAEAADDWPDSGNSLTRPKYGTRGVFGAPPGFYVKAAARGGFDYGRWHLYIEPALRFFPFYLAGGSGNVTGDAPSAYGDNQYMRPVSIFSANSLKFTLSAGFSAAVGGEK
ncbi:MAG: hypothetical protein LBG74_05350 [Spirochaetaceae bacterium]|jgi:hypothetical protein|nr:hypothetical protein [Spirochaetaceae bacterium]